MDKLPNSFKSFLIYFCFTTLRPFMSCKLVAMYYNYIYYQVIVRLLITECNLNTLGLMKSEPGIRVVFRVNWKNCNSYPTSFKKQNLALPQQFGLAKPLLKLWQLYKNEQAKVKPKFIIINYKNTEKRQWLKKLAFDLDEMWNINPFSWKIYVKTFYSLLSYICHRFPL